MLIIYIMYNRTLDQQRAKSAKKTRLAFRAKGTVGLS